MLQAPDDTDLSLLRICRFFADWRTRWVDYVALIKVMDDVRITTARQSLLHSALYPIRQFYGRHDIALDDDIDGNVEKKGRYLRLRRNPLLERKDFFNHNQKDGENIDQYVSALVRIHNQCGFDDMEEDRYLQGGHSCGHTNWLRESRIRDRLILASATQACSAGCCLRISEKS